MNGSKSFLGGWLPGIACFSSAFLLGMVHWSLFNTMPDAASAMQTFHAILRDGFGARNSLEGVDVLSIHLWFLPMVALPLFALFPVYPCLVAVQSLFLSLSVPAAYRLGLSVGLPPIQARRWTWFWALHPLVLGPHCGWGEGYQPMIFALTPLLWALAFARESKWGWFLVCNLLALSCREDVSLVTFGFGIWAFWPMGNRKVGIAVMGFSLLYAALATLVILPHLGGGNWSLLARTFTPRSGPFSPMTALWGVARNILQPATFGYLLFVFIGWGGFGRRSAGHLLAIVPLCAALFLVEVWTTRNPFMHYAAPLAPLFFHAALLEARDAGGPFPWRWKAGWVVSALALAGWQGKLLYNGVHGADRKSLVCLESKLPRDRSLSLFSPRGATRFAWGQDLTYMDPATPPADFTLVETGRKTPNWWNPAELAAMEANLAARGATLAYQAPTVRVWALRDHRGIVCP